LDSNLKKFCKIIFNKYIDIKYKSLTITVGLLCFISIHSIGKEKFSAKAIANFASPNLLSTHTLGLFSARVSPNFQLEASKRIRFQCDVGTGNVWAPHVQTFKPKSAEDRALVAETFWHQRDNPSLRALAHDSSSFHADAIIKTFIPSLVLPINAKSEIKFSLRTFLVTEGNFPFATIISDGFIEAFHSNIKGGEDPFARKVYGFNKANISFTDQNGKSIQLKRNDFVFAGCATDYFYYLKPTLPLLGQVYTNIGVHLGINTTKTNPSIDIGISQMIIKELLLGQHSFLLVGMGTQLLRKNLVNYTQGLTLTSNPYLFSFSVEPKLVKETKKGKKFAIAWNFHYQSPYNRRRAFDQSIFVGERHTSHWHLGTTHLYQALETHTFVLSFFKKNNLSFYFQQDFKVNNNADLQTGVSYQFAL